MFAVSTILVTIFLTAHVFCMHGASGHLHTRCPTGWISYADTDNKCIKAFGEGKPYTDALEYCEQFKNGTLVSIHNAFQNAQVGTHFYDLENQFPYYIGLNNLKNISKYEWVDGSVLDYTNWHFSPRYGDLYGVEMHSDISTLGKWDCDYYLLPFYFVCMQDL